MEEEHKGAPRAHVDGHDDAQASDWLRPPPSADLHGGGDDATDAQHHAFSGSAVLTPEPAAFQRPRPLFDDADDPDQAPPPPRAAVSPVPRLNLPLQPQRPLTPQLELRSVLKQPQQPAHRGQPEPQPRAQISFAADTALGPDVSSGRMSAPLDDDPPALSQQRRQPSVRRQQRDDGAAAAADAAGPPFTEAIASVPLVPSDSGAEEEPSWEAELAGELARAAALPSSCQMVDEDFNVRDEFKRTHADVQFVYALQLKSFDPDFDDSAEAEARWRAMDKLDYFQRMRRYKRNFNLVFKHLCAVLGGDVDVRTGQSAFGSGAQYLGYMRKGKYDPSHAYIQVGASLQQMEELAESIKMQMPGLNENFHNFDTLLKGSRARFAHPQGRHCPSEVDAYFRARRAHHPPLPGDLPDEAVVTQMVRPDPETEDDPHNNLAARKQRFRDQHLRDLIEGWLKAGHSRAQILDLRPEAHLAAKGPQFESADERDHLERHGHAHGRDGFSARNKQKEPRQPEVVPTAAAQQPLSTDGDAAAGTDPSARPKSGSKKKHKSKASSSASTFTVPECTCDLFVPYQKEELVRRLIERALDNALEELDSEKSTPGNGVRELKRRKVIKDSFPLHYEPSPLFYRVKLRGPACRTVEGRTAAFGYHLVGVCAQYF